MLEISDLNSFLSDHDSLDIDPNNVNLVDNEELMLSNVKIKSIKTPGHTSGHMIHIVDDKYLFSGDALEMNNMF